MAKQFIISIGREYGSGGRVIAEELAKRYNVNLYGKNLLDLVAQEKNLNLDELKKYVDLCYFYKVKYLHIHFPHIIKFRFWYL